MTENYASVHWLIYTTKSLSCFIKLSSNFWIICRNIKSVSSSWYLVRHSTMRKKLKGSLFLLFPSLWHISIKIFWLNPNTFSAFSPHWHLQKATNLFSGKCFVSNKPCLQFWQIHFTIVFGPTQLHWEVYIIVCTQGLSLTF